MHDMHDYYRDEGIELERDMLSCSTLMPMRKSGIKRIMKEFKTVRSSTKRIMMQNLHSAYHKQSVIVDPFLAVDELMMRVLYEVLNGLISPRALFKRMWLRSYLRDWGHNKRMVMLVRAIESSDEAVKRCLGVKWLGFGNALKRMEK